MPRAFLPGLVALVVGALAAATSDLPPLAIAAAVALVALAGIAAARAPSNAIADDGRRSIDGLRSDGVGLVIAALPVPALLLDADQTIRVASDAARTAFPGVEPGRPFPTLFRHPDLSALVLKAMAGTPGTAEHRERGAGLRGRAWSVTAVRLEPKPAQPDGRAVLVVFADATAERSATRVRTDFVAFASHELRTPIAAVRAAVDTLKGPARGDPAAERRFLDLIDEQAARMQRLVDDLLSLSRVEARAHRAPETTVDLAAIVARAADAIGGLAAAEGVALHLVGHDPLQVRGPLYVRGDADELYHVAQNLLQNAIRHGGSGGRVEVKLARDGGRATLGVRDHGPGIAPEHLPRITERFYRVDAETSRAKGGTGLGLAIVKHVVARHGGDLRITSEAGKGAEFRVSLPLLEAGADPQRTP